jgi:hypothetical protein
MTMNKAALTFCFVQYFFCAAAQGPSEQYSRLVSQADSAYNKGDFKTSVLYYTAAFKACGWKGQPGDRYNAACCWALSGQADSAFLHLEFLAEKSRMKDYGHITSDGDLNSLHVDKRWAPLIEKVRLNKERAEVNLNKPLARQLDSIYVEDQKYRLMMDNIEKQHGFKSKEMQDLWKVIMKKDSSNLVVITAVLDKYGWLGPDFVGDQGASTLFLVIQHSDTKTQVKYLPMMREAVKNGNARSENLALLEDRVALAQGKKQIYGSQIQQDPNTGKYFVAPIEDEPNVNKRRASVGLGPLEDYVRRWDIDYKLPR